MIERSSMADFVEPSEFNTAEGESPFTISNKLHARGFNTLVLFTTTQVLVTQALFGALEVYDVQVITSENEKGAAYILIYKFKDAIKQNAEQE